MKTSYSILILLFSCLANTVIAQKHDNNWLLGYPPNDTLRGLGGTQLNFTKGDPHVSNFPTPCPLGVSTTASDANEGELLFYTNGCRIFKKNHTLMENGDTLSPGKFFNVYCNGRYPSAYPVTQGLLALPLPNQTEQYGLFHLRLDDRGFLTDLLYTEIDMNVNNGLGRVVKKNQLLLRDTLSNYLTATRHANGRDWWIITPKNTWQKFTNVYYTFLLTPSSIEGPFAQSLGKLWGYGDCCGQSVFSPDGSKYVRSTPFIGLYVYDFDRCDGALSNPVHIDVPTDSTSVGVAVSPNSRFLYVSVTDKIYQYDLHSPSIASTQKLVAEYDGFKDPASTYFFQAMLAPNGKIYLTSVNTVKSLHIIHQPNEPDTACHVEQHGLKLKTLADWQTPNFPHFRLGTLEGSPCDTLTGITESPAEARFNVFPNPTTEAITISLTTPLSQPATIKLFNYLGEKMLEQSLEKGEQEVTLPISHLPQGLYLLTFVSEGRVVQTEKVVVVK